MQDGDEMKDKWRYVSLPDWMLDNIMEPENPEDKMIAAIDGEVEESESFNAYGILGNLSAKESMVVQSICYDGMTFEATGKAMKLSKQRIHQIYTGALKKLKIILEEDNKETYV